MSRISIAKAPHMSHIGPGIEKEGLAQLYPSPISLPLSVQETREPGLSCTTWSLAWFCTPMTKYTPAGFLWEVHNQQRRVNQSKRKTSNVQNLTHLGHEQSAKVYAKKPTHSNNTAPGPYQQKQAPDPVPVTTSPLFTASLQYVKCPVDFFQPNHPSFDQAT
jgi:hypothetical protein